MYIFTSFLVPTTCTNSTNESNWCIPCRSQYHSPSHRQGNGSSEFDNPKTHVFPLGNGGDCVYQSNLGKNPSIENDAVILFTAYYDGIASCFVYSYSSW